jgi:1-aminocyclopropane-1-carboxylate deaminase/D-cysteine desulfhydrase-like pyridoxal-dependent ACC family enzyme
MKAAQTAIQKALCNHPNAHLSIPTPIHLLNRISATLKCSIYIKREDLTGFALGGNKIRKLDFLIADAVKQKADTLITKKTSSFTRNAAAAAKAFNLDLHVFIPGDERTHNVLSQAVFEQFGTARQCANLLNVQCSCSSLAVDDQFIGEAYAVPTSQGEKAVKMFADLEGIFLDQVYTGKAASGMIHYAETGRFNDHHSILFIHTGGNAGAYY